MRWFIDERNPEMILSEATVRQEYEELIATTDDNRTFSEYLRCCMTDEGGTLTEVLQDI